MTINEFLLMLQNRPADWELDEGIIRTKSKYLRYGVYMCPLQYLFGATAYAPMSEYDRASIMDAADDDKCMNQALRKKLVQACFHPPKLLPPHVETP